MNAIFRLANGIICALLFLSAAVQWNDPDPLRWIAVYGAAFLVCLVVALRGRIPAAVPMVVAVIALGWAALVIGEGPSLSAYARMFGSWEMRAPAVEEAREATGLLITGSWLVVVAVAQTRARKAK